MGTPPCSPTKAHYEDETPTQHPQPSAIAGSGRFDHPLRDVSSMSETSKVPNTPNAHTKPVVIGIYGVPGCGKSFLLQQLGGLKETELAGFTFFEGSEVIANVIPGTLDQFKKMPENEKDVYREKSIISIRDRCLQESKSGVVTGHLMFWNHDQEAAKHVIIKADLETYTHIIYLDVRPEIVSTRIRADSTRLRQAPNVDHIAKWQLAEKTYLRQRCREEGILFTSVSVQQNSEDLEPSIVRLLQNFASHHNGTRDEYRALQMLDDLMFRVESDVHQILVLDADKTLSEDDGTEMLWAQFPLALSDRNPLKRIFSSNLGYSHLAFWQATLLCHEIMQNDEEYGKACATVAQKICLYPEIQKLLEHAVQDYSRHALIVTSGSRLLWQKVIDRYPSLSGVKVIGGGRLSDGFVVTPSTKAAIVDRLGSKYNKYVMAFGDSPLDLEMLKTAAEAYVIVGEREKRSQSMDKKLMSYIQSDPTFRPRQIKLPNHVEGRLSSHFLPGIFMDLLIPPLNPSEYEKTFSICHQTGSGAARLLMTPTRDASISGPALRAAHHRIGFYLATSSIADIIGMSEYTIPHVQGNTTTGYRLNHENRTTIVALMRGGEPMAFGISEAFPLATFAHASSASDLKNHHLKDQENIILVDSVINNGKTVKEFVERIRKLNQEIRIVVVAGVVQQKSVEEGGLLWGIGGKDGGRAAIVALRLSDNKFTGTKDTDTGNRLFNTPHLE